MYAMLTTVAPECHELQDGVNANLAFWKAHPGAPPAELVARSDAKGTTIVIDEQTERAGSPFIRASPRSAAPVDPRTTIALPGAVPGEVEPYDRHTSTPRASPAALEVEEESDRLLDI
jgi:hypothetical protein